MNVKFERMQIVLHVFISGKIYMGKNKSVQKANGGVFIGTKRTIAFSEIPV